jgi:hypothetical protein
MPKFYKTLREYAAYLCKREGGKSQAKIHDVHQILCMIADDFFLDWNLGYDDKSPFGAKKLSKIEPVDLQSLFISAGAKRWIRKMSRKSIGKRKKRKLK